MATPQLKAFVCIDHDPISDWIPESDTEVYYSLCLHIGPPDEDGADQFYVDVTTLQGISEQNISKHLNKRTIVVNPYSWKAVLKAVLATLVSCSGDTWKKQTELLAKRFDWEFQNYRTYTP